MAESVELNGVSVNYTLRYSKRSRNVRVVIHPDDGVVVSVPDRWHERFVKGFLMRKSDWILKHLERAKKHREGKIIIRQREDEYKKNKLAVLGVITRRTEFFNTFYKYTYKKISIRNQTSLWGSCTRKGNLQFNYKLIHLPQSAVDYVIVHELCHLKEHNHGPGFWKLVERMIPDYKTIRKSLHNYVMKEG